MIEFIKCNFETILTVITTVIAPILIFLVFQLLRRPRLEIESIIMTGSRKRGNHTNYPYGTDKKVYADQLNYIYNYVISFKFSVLNNSEIDGYDASIEFVGVDNLDTWVNGSLNFSPIKAHDKQHFEGKIRINREAGYSNPPEINEIQKEIRDMLSIRTAVKNKYRVKKFYTLFDGNQNNFYLRKPK